MQIKYTHKYCTVVCVSVCVLVCMCVTHTTSNRQQSARHVYYTQKSTAAAATLGFASLLSLPCSFFFFFYAACPFFLPIPIQIYELEMPFKANRTRLLPLNPNFDYEQSSVFQPTSNWSLEV